MLALAAAAGPSSCSCSLLGRWRLARLLVPIGLAVVLISVLIDAPAGVDEGTAADLYEGACASLLAGFWTQLAAGVVIGWWRRFSPSASLAAAASPRRAPLVSASRPAAPRLGPRSRGRHVSTVEVTGFRWERLPPIACPPRRPSSSPPS